MSNYKVPQDVEADDKVLGPLSFRQFLYLGIVAACIGVSIALAKLALPLGFLLSPVILLFGALALPLRKDQPMETYLAALISFILKPRTRLWDSDIVEAELVITASKNEGVARTKNINREEAKNRLSYLSTLVDSPNLGTFRDDFYAEAIYATDILDPSANYIQINNSLANVDREQKELAIAKMKRFLKSNEQPQQAQVSEFGSLGGKVVRPIDSYSTSDLPISVIEERANQQQGEGQL
ncbi:MAG: PrgI family protein [Candidatus Nomurabacteria bacterium]|jgi:hypothetical protein|nr:PrgI family protein [Candidatus Nomurabacteria bacterium]